MLTARVQPAHTTAFISNKGGVGKTHIAVNLAIQLVKEGRRVLLVDTDLSSANADLRLGVRPAKTLMDFFEKRSDIFECLVPSGYGVHFLAGRSGDFGMANLKHQQKIRLLRAFDRLVQRGGYTDIFFDLGAGIGNRVLDFALVADECVIVATPTDIISAYAALKACWVRHTGLSDMLYFKDRTKAFTSDPSKTGINGTGGLRMNFIVNQADNLAEAKKVYLKILDVARTFFYTENGRTNMPIRYLGGIPYVQGLLRQAERAKIPATAMFPYHPFSQAIREITNVMIEKREVAPNRLNIPFTQRVRGVVRTWVGT